MNEQTNIFDEMTEPFKRWYYNTWPSVTDGLHRILKWREWQESASDAKGEQQ